MTARNTAPRSTTRIVLGSVAFAAGLLCNAAQAQTMPAPALADTPARPDRNACQGRRTPGHRLAARHPPAPRARQPRGPHREARRRAPARARPRGARRASRTPASSACSRAASPARSWRCAPTWTRCRSTEEVDVPFASKAQRRPGTARSRRDARLRPRRAHRDPDGRGRGARRHARPSCRAR